MQCEPRALRRFLFRPELAPGCAGGFALRRWTHAPRPSAHASSNAKPFFRRGSA